MTTEKTEEFYHILYYKLVEEFMAKES